MGPLPQVQVAIRKPFDSTIEDCAASPSTAGGRAERPRRGWKNSAVVIRSVIRGDTGHYDFVAGECASGIQQVQLSTGELSIKKTSAAIEEILIRRALTKTKGNRTRAAEILEISHRALLYKIKDYRITDL